jgi:hypothetical protein
MEEWNDAKLELYKVGKKLPTADCRLPTAHCPLSTATHALPLHKSYSFKK